MSSSNHTSKLNSRNRAAPCGATGRVRRRRHAPLQDAPIGGAHEHQPQNDPQKLCWSCGSRDADAVIATSGVGGRAGPRRRSARRHATGRDPQARYSAKHALRPRIRRTGMDLPRSCRSLRIAATGASDSEVRPHHRRNRWAQRVWIACWLGGHRPSSGLRGPVESLCERSGVLPRHLARGSP